MQKQAPSIGRIAIAAGFALSCFGLLLFLWAAFGGPIPFKPKGYRFTADFPEATQLAIEADVRISGVSVGKVKQLDLPDGSNRTRATMELDREFAPVAEDTRAMLRLKTLLGETYVELTPGSKAGGKVPDGGHLGTARVRSSVEIDEVFEALDARTRQNFRDWMEYQGAAIRGRGDDFNAALGNLGPFADDAADLLEVLDLQGRALQRLVRDTGEVFGALTEREQELGSVIVNSNETFSATAEQDEALAETFRIFPTFLDESRVTLARLEGFSRDANPLVDDLKPVADDLGPTLRNVRLLAPDLEELFRDLDPLIDASRKGVPALEAFLKELPPLMRQLDPFLANLSPVLRFLTFHKNSVNDFIAGPASALWARNAPIGPDDASKHYLRLVNHFSSESAAIWPSRLSTNRGNGYLQPLIIGRERSASFYETVPNWDCKPSGGELKGAADEGDVEAAPCTVQPDYPAEFGAKHNPQVSADK